MIDNHMKHYYNRIYNARPSLEIARTRPRRSSSASRASSRISGGSIVSSGNQKLGRSNSSLELSKKIALYPCSEARFRHVTKSSDYRIRSKHHPSERAPQALLSSDDERLSFLDQGYRGNVHSSQELQNQLSDMKAPILRSSLEQIHANDRSSRNMSDKIANFLSVVQKCELELADEYEMRRQRIEARKRKPALSRSVSNISHLSTSRDTSRKVSMLSQHSGSMSTLMSSQHSRQPAKKPESTSRHSQVSKVYGQNGSTRPFPRPSTGTRAMPKPRNIRPSTANSARIVTPVPTVSSLTLHNRKSIRDYPLPDTTNVSSRLKRDRNYQPPRRKALTKKAPSSKTRLTAKRSSVDYEDDFEDPEVREESEEEARDADDDDFEDEHFELVMTRKWLDDQRVRGLARQKAMLLQKQHGSYEKESSKDSAYGYSGGESRLQTPDNYAQSSFIQRKQRQKSANPVIQFNGIPRNSSMEKADKSTVYVNFVNKVTTDILQRGIFTEKGLKEVLENHMRSHDGITTQEAQTLLSKLKKEFGIQTSNTSRSLSSSMNDVNLRDILYDNRQPRSQSIHAKSSIEQRRDDSDPFQDLSDAELVNILKDVNLDDEQVNHLLHPNPKSSLSSSRPNSGRQLKPALPILTNMDISDLNISFNANPDSSREKKSQQKALLIKSFAKNRPNEAATRKKSAPAAPMKAVHPSQYSAGNRRPSIANHHPRKPIRAPRASTRQDSSSSNPDQSPTHAHHNHHSSRPNSSRRRSTRSGTRNPPPSTDNQLPDTPLHSSETPRSSSLYHPETEEDEILQQPMKNQDENSEISEDCEAVPENNDDDLLDDDGNIDEELDHSSS